MKQEDKLRQRERYERAKKAGESFFPFTLFKDHIAIVAVFSVIVTLALLVGGELEAMADPSDTSYIPRPEWYFLFLFELLKYFPGELEPVATVVIPGLAVGVLFLLPFLDRSPTRQPWKRPFGMGIGLLVVMGIAGLTYLGATGEQLNPGGPTESEAVHEGRLLYEDFRCGFCHSIRGVGGVVGPDLTSVDPETVDEWLGAHVEDGPGAMPVPDLILLPEEVEALTAYLETLAGVGASPGAMVFQDNCVACHRFGNIGGGSGPDLTGIDERHDLASLTQFVKDPTATNPNSAMPAYGEILSTEQIDAVANYLLGEEPDDTGSGTPFVDRTDGAATGATLFNQSCSACHQFQGEGGSLGPDLTDTGQTRDSAYLQTFIADPAAVDPQNTMMGFSDRLSEDEIEAIASYLLGEEAPAGTATATPPPSPTPVPLTGDVKRGSELFAQYCPICHQFQGVGGTVLGPDLTDVGQKHDRAFLQTFIADPAAVDPQNTMMGYSDRLTEDEIEAIVSYLLGGEAPPATASPPEATPEPPPEATPEPTPEATPEPTPTAVPVSGDAEKGGELFGEHCGTCHQFQGVGSSGGIDLTGIGDRHDADWIRQFTENPSGVVPDSSMPGFKGILSDEEISEIAGFLAGE